MSALHRTLSRRWFEEVWNDRRTEAIDELMSPDGIGHMESGDFEGPGPFKEIRDQFLAAFPDLRIEIEDVVADGDDVVVRWRASGTHTGDGFGFEPSRRPVSFRGMTWHRYKDGVLVEGWDGWNQDGLFRSLEPGPAGVGDPEVVRRRSELAGRIREIRAEVLGESGGPEMARRLGLPARTWYNYETGVTVPAEVLLGFLEETGVEPHWLFSGEGPRYRRTPEAAGPSPIELLRIGLEKLESEDRDAERDDPDSAPLT
ncbi:ester cyclase [Paludisphaera soli]|uniref:ester cyclase n=1 Tax=Paludisphaera soli TaxID=2712865 RepID=UPI001F0EAD24|nr:ester cyclase [Paludisphaera soli]